MFRHEVIELQKNNPNMRLHICYSRPNESDVKVSIMIATTAALPLLDEAIAFFE